MAFVGELWFIPSIIGLVVLNLQLFALSKPQVPCYFIFGDSLYDNGNNNNLNTTAKVNYPPYGVDFPEGPTGRFTNGRNNADFMAELLGFDRYIPPFANTTGREISEGVNYASGASGILDLTGCHVGELFSFNKQLQNHQRIISRLLRLMGNEAATKEHLAKCLYTVALGNNDYINNYLLPKYYPTSLIYTPEQYARILIQQYSQQLRLLYRLGARKIAIFGVGSLGCIPAELSVDSTCVDYINNEVQLFNDKLMPLVDQLNSDLRDARFIYVDVTAVNSNNSSMLAEITIDNVPCCKVVSTTLAAGKCIPGQVPCINRNQYYFWDDAHPTEIVNEAFSTLAYSALSPLLDAHPFGTGGVAELSSPDKVETQ